MYSDEVIVRNLVDFKRKHPNVKVQRRDLDESLTRSRLLGKLWNPKENQPLRPFTESEVEFMTSERIMCRLDFPYWARRYGYIEQDQSGVAPIKFWENQKISLRLTGKREEEVWKEFNGGKGITTGILQVDHKTRQVGRTALTRLQMMHRLCFYSNVRGMSATIAKPNDESKVLLYTRDKVCYDNMPFFLKPKLFADARGSRIQFTEDSTASHMVYNDSTQKGGIGTGGQFDVHHITECALWDEQASMNTSGTALGLDRLVFEFLPGLPKHPFVLGVWESTANGRNNTWHKMTENIRHKRRGYEHWTYCFTPYYLEAKKYSMATPESWVPDELTILHAENVEKSSPEFNEGKTFRLSREQMYWWETTREFHKLKGILNVFYSNYCATPEESFQSSGKKALPFEILEWMGQSAALPGIPYQPTWLQ